MSELIKAEDRLAELQRLAIRAHEESLECAKSAVANAIAAGQALAEAKKLCKHGEWLPWLKENWPFSQRLAQDYMRIANTQSSAYLDQAESISDALRLIDKAESEEVDCELDEQTQSFTCVECGDQFDEPVWHCELCGGHWPDDVAACKTCEELQLPSVPSILEDTEDEEAEYLSDEQLESEITDDEPDLNDEPAKLWFSIAEWEAFDVIHRQEAVEQASETKFNRQDNASIEWARWSWNPVTGCKHDCPYCYARDIANRFYEQKFEPSFYPSRLTAPGITKVPDSAEQDVSYKNVFTCSMADLFGKWVPLEWIEMVFETVAENTQWNFLFLTKFPQRFAELSEIPDNAWLGTTVDCQSRVKNAEKAFAKCGGGTKWLSVEPMLTRLKFDRLDLFDWVVIGGSSASTQTPVWKPPFDWVADLHWQARDADCAIYHKDNLGFDDGVRLREFPWQEQKEKELPGSLKYLNIK